MSVISPYSESPFNTDRVFYSVFDDVTPELSPEYELAINSQLDFLSIDNNNTPLSS